MTSRRAIAKGLYFAHIGWLLDEPRVRFVAFTGSTEVGAAIQQRAGLRRTQMELGSIAFTIVADDADLDRALPRVVGAAYRKAGRFWVEGDHLCSAALTRGVWRNEHSTCRNIS